MYSRKEAAIFENLLSFKMRYFMLAKQGKNVISLKT